MTADAGVHQTVTPIQRNRHRAFPGVSRHSLQMSISLTVITIVILVSLFAPLLAPYSPYEGDAAQKFLPMGAEGHLLGTDELGRDLLSRLLHGGRTSLLLAVVSVVIATVIGTVGALLAAFSGPQLQGLIMRSVDVAFAFPVILVAITLAAVVGGGWPVIIFSIVFAVVPYVVRVMFAEVKRQHQKDYIEAAVSLGASRLSLIFHEVLPNIFGAVVIYATGLVGAMIVFASSLSAVGIGVQPPEADWGQMIASGARVVISGHLHVAMVPGIAVLIVALSFNWLGDAIHDKFHYHTRKGGN